MRTGAALGSLMLQCIAIATFSLCGIYYSIYFTDQLVDSGPLTKSEDRLQSLHDIDNGALKWLKTTATTYSRNVIQTEIVQARKIKNQIC